MTQSSCFAPAVQSLTLLMLAALTTGASAMPASLTWHTTVSTAKQALASRCETLREVRVDPPRFPLAADSETHLLCRGYAATDGEVGALALSFGDDRLQLIEARGGAAAVFGPSDGGESGSYLHYLVLDGGERFIDQAQDTVWFLSKSARHPNLFTWLNPLLKSDGELQAYDPSAATPAMLEFGGSLESLRSQYEKNCPVLQIEPQKRIWLPHKPETQTQVNCFGFEYAGFPRKIEAVFGDGKLEVVWILTGAEEEDRVRQALIAEFGAPIRVTGNWELFEERRVALRKDKPEVLLISADMVPHYQKYFDEE